MTKRKKILLGFLGLILVFVLWDAWLIYFHTPGWEPAFSSTSPDGRFTVSVYSNVGVIRLPPGLNPRGRAGTVVLRENKTGKVLQRAFASYVQGSDQPHVAWYTKSNSVGVVGVDTWDLPPE